MRFDYTPLFHQDSIEQAVQKRSDAVPAKAGMQGARDYEECGVLFVRRSDPALAGMSAIPL
jgi:hypothetical protein